MPDLPLPTAPPAASGTSPKRVLAERYRLERRLAVGGMAEVWVATDLVLDRAVAIKLLKPSLAGDAVLVERFRREAVAAARLSHPSIVGVFDTVNVDGAEAVVMELVNGSTLRQTLNEESRLSVAATLHIGTSLADALTAAHRARIVHRDLKPGNVLLTPEGRVLLTDFGIAKAFQEASDLTRHDVTMGTAKYLSPEQVLGVPLDGRSDLYALGILLYECLTGKVPFLGSSDAETAMVRLQSDPVPVRSLRPGVPRALDDLIMALLARQRDSRPHNAALVRDALSRIRARLDDGYDHTPTPEGGHDRTVSIDGTPPGTKTEAIEETRDHTPTTGVVLGRPSEHRRWVVAFASVCGVGALLATAGGLVARTGTGERFIDAVREKVTGKTDPPATTTIAPGTVAPSGRSSVVGVREFDPPPLGDDRENPSQLGALTDGKADTAWSTVCYNDRDLAPKAGVGLIFELSTSVQGRHLAVTTPTQGGWGAQVYVGDAAADTLAAWGKPVDGATDLASGEHDFSLGDGPGRYVLLWIDELGASTPPCTRPYQLKIGSIDVT